MISPKYFTDLLVGNGVEFFSGVPDSTLKSFCSYLIQAIPKDRHTTCANEGGAVGMAIGHHLASGKVGAVYMQNSGIGNAINPLLSLADEEVYSVPVLLIIGWRGEPGEKDEPQHKKQGQVTLSLLEAMNIPFTVLSQTPDRLSREIEEACHTVKKRSAPYALIIRKGTFDSYGQNEFETVFPLTREETLKLIVSELEDDDILVSTTGMASRELFEYRASLEMGHERDFLTVGGMGHSSQIALAIAKTKPNRRVFCIDGDGSALMHMGSMAVNGTEGARNFYHILLNNGAHDSVGGHPTVGYQIDFKGIAKASGYRTVLDAQSEIELLDRMKVFTQSQGPSILEMRIKKGNRSDLGRPTVSPQENKIKFMGFLT